MIWWPLLAGAGVGALMDPKNPLRGAALGGLAGGVGGHFLGAGGAGAGGAGAGGAAAAASPAQAAMFADPTALGVATEAMTGGVAPSTAASMAGMSPQATSALAAGKFMGPSLAGQMAPGAMAMEKFKKMMMMNQMMSMMGGGSQRRQY